MPAPGRRIVSDYVFQFVAGQLCLDFLNTLGDRAGDPPSEHLDDYAELVRWSLEAGAIDARLAATLAREGRKHPQAARHVLLRARNLREAVYRIVTAVRERTPPAGADLDLFNRELGGALANSRVEVRDNGGFTLAWRDSVALDRPLWPLLRSAADLLAMGEMSRVKACASDSCEWVFMDESRNRSRQWCQMEVCGNRAKARRHYARSRERGSGAARDRSNVDRSRRS